MAAIFTVLSALHNATNCTMSLIIPKLLVLKLQGLMHFFLKNFGQKTFNLQGRLARYVSHLFVCSVEDISPETNNVVYVIRCCSQETKSKVAGGKRESACETSVSLIEKTKGE